MYRYAITFVHFQGVHLFIYAYSLYWIPHINGRYILAQHVLLYLVEASSWHDAFTYLLINLPHLSADKSIILWRQPISLPLALLVDHTCYFPLHLYIAVIIICFPDLPVSFINILSGYFILGFSSFTKQLIYKYSKNSSKQFCHCVVGLLLVIILIVIVDFTYVACIL